VRGARTPHDLRKQVGTMAAVARERGNSQHVSHHANRMKEIEK
jgi:hypothetical protein